MESSRLLKGASDVIDVRDFFQRWDSSVIPGLVCDKSIQNSEHDAISKEMGVSVDTAMELNSVCGVDTLKNGDEPPDTTLLTSIPNEIDLMTVKLQCNDLDKREKSSHYKQFIYKKFKYKTIQEKLCPYNTKELSQPQPELPIEFKIEDDVILEISVHCPMTPYTHRYPASRLAVDQKFQVLGSQNLTELRDKISCVNDLAIAGDASDNPDDNTGFYAKDVYRSGFFYMEGIFYNDLREVDSRDYSSVIRKWAEGPERGVGPTAAVSMEEATFFDLKVRLGQPYVYIHQGNCEHILIFNDVRLFHSDDVKDRREYPRLMFKRTYKRTVCRVCQIHSARWLTYGSEHSPDDPSYFCDLCFRALHYDKDGSKLGNFKAHKFFDKHAVV